MPVVNTDAVLWYNVGQFGELGYGVPNHSDDPGSLNTEIIDVVNMVGRNLFHIMHERNLLVHWLIFEKIGVIIQERLRAV